MCTIACLFFKRYAKRKKREKRKKLIPACISFLRYIPESVH
jgi:hypothetical protein